MSLPLMLTLLAAAASVQDPATGLIRGRITSETTGAPLPFAEVEVLGVPAPIDAMADSTGAYVLEDVPSGRQVLRVSHLDHAPLEVQVLVPAGGVVILSLALELRPIPLPPITARARPGTAPDDSMAAPESSLADAAVHALEATPGLVELGLGESGAGDGGSPDNEPGGHSDVLFVRGAAANLKRVLLDGAPVYTPFHLGGLIHPFEPDLLSSADLYLGGAPARYDGGLSYILDLRTRAGRRDGLHAAGGLDLLSGRLRVEGPLGGRGGFLAAGRAIHPFAGALLLSGPFPYEYADLLVRTDLDLGEDGVLAATAFWNHEAVALDDAGSAASSARWGNRAGSLRYQGKLGETEARFTAGFGRFEARLPIAGAVPFITGGASEQVRVSLDFARPAGPAHLRYGVAYEQLRLLYRARLRTAADGPPLGETRANSNLFGIYVDAAWQPTPRLRLRGGVRADHFSLDRGLRFGPRLAATWMVGERAALTLAAGRYHQYVRDPERTLTALSTWVSGPTRTTALSVAGASHLTLALEQVLGETVRLGLDGYFKRFRGLPAERTHTRASGVDVWVRRTGGSVTGWAGYSLEWVWSLSPAATAPGDPRGTDVFSGRQLVSAGLEGPLGSAGNFALRLAYGAGLPYTAVPTGFMPERVGLDSQPAQVQLLSSAGPEAELAGPPDQPYLRLDIELSHTWSSGGQGTGFQFTPYLKVLNALDQRDALFYQFEPGGSSELRPLGALPILPVIGVRWSF